MPNVYSTFFLRPKNSFDKPPSVTYRSVSFMARATNHSETRRHILRAALKHFANAGYAATSVQQIVSDAKVSKPALYYHFRDKAALFKALVNEAHDGRFRVVQAAAARAPDFPGQLREVLVALFDYFKKNRNLTRIAFATAYAAPGELPPGLNHLGKCRRSLEFIHSLIQRARAAGELDDRFDSRDLAYGFYGQTNFYITAHLLMPHYQLNRRAAERVVELFLAGAGSKKRGSKKS
jgi:AcrR family transcriptional regulator